MISNTCQRGFVALDHQSLGLAKSCVRAGGGRRQARAARACLQLSAANGLSGANSEMALCSRLERLVDSGECGAAPTLGSTEVTSSSATGEALELLGRVDLAQELLARHKSLR